MISAVSNSVNFRGDIHDLINSPGQFSFVQTPAVSAPAAPAPVDSYGKYSRLEENSDKKSYTSAIVGTLIAAAAAFVALGYAYRNGHLEHVNVSEVEGTAKKLWTRCKNVGTKIGEAADNSYNKILEWVGKAEKTEKKS